MLTVQRVIPGRRRAGSAGPIAGLLLAMAWGATSIMGTEASAAPLFAAPFLSFDAGGFPYSVAIGDLSGDGKPELIVANSNATLSNTVSVLPGNGDGTFGPRTDYATGRHPASVVIADFNLDGRPDVAVAN